MEIRLAQKTDNRALIDLTQASPIAGTVSIRIDRLPNFFALARLRGKGDVLVVADKERVIACATVNYKELYIQRELHTVGYIADMKVSPNRRGSMAAVKLLTLGQQMMMNNGAEIAYCVIGDENAAVHSVLDGRCGFPKFHKATQFAVYQIFPSRFGIHSKSHRIDVARAEDFSDIAELCSRHNQNYQLAPKVVTADLESISQQSTNNSASNVYIVRRNKQIVATLSTFDCHFAKQNIVVDMPLSLRALAMTTRALGSLSPIGNFPRIGEPLRTLSIRHFAYLTGHEKEASALIQLTRKLAAEHGYTFVSLGLDVRDTTRKVLKSSLAYKVYADCMVASLTGRQALLDKALEGIFYSDFALV